MIDTYVRLIKHGRMTLNDIEDEVLKEEVRKILIEDGWIEE